MNFRQLIYQNKNFKYLSLIILIFILSFKANTEIPEKYKIQTSLPQCKGADYTKWTDCYGEYVFPRNEYKGEWKDGKFHGKGILKEAWGAIYFGDFINNMADGYGRQEEPNGSWWEGEVKNDDLHGKGIYFNAHSKCREEGNYVKWILNGPGKIECEDGFFKEGNFKNSLLQGKGIVRFASGTVYSGEFKDDKLNGQGEIKFANGTVYSGEFKDDEINGQGEIKWNTGSFEKGQFTNSTLNGEGIYISHRNDKYEGTFLDGKKDGKGKYTWANGDYFEGTFKKDNKIYGTFTFTNGDKQTCEFENDICNGKGKIVYSNGNKWEGILVDDIKNGKGTYIWADGDKYEGNYSDGLRTGKGKYTYKSGTVYEGDFLENYGEGEGKYTYSDGSIYEGEVKEGYEDGQGRMVYENGDIYEGQWKEGFKHGQGKMLYADGKEWNGIWENGKKAEGKTTLAKFTTDEKYYALIIGNNNYQHLEKLDAAENDAREIGKVLEEKYGFESTVLLSKNYADTADAIIKFTKNRKNKDNLLIYYAGHGELEKSENRGYWLPIDAGKEQDSKWLGNDSVKNWIRSSKANNILLIVDSCFSGSLMRGGSEDKLVEKLTPKSIIRLQSKKTRIVFTSGGEEPVVDSDGGQHSYFADKLIKELRNNNDVIVSLQLFQSVRQYVIDNALGQTPEHSMIHGTGHDGGEFLFFPKG